MSAIQLATRVPAVKRRHGPWRNVLPIHPTTELFPRMTPDELRALGEDIKKKAALRLGARRRFRLQEVSRRQP
jgi:hypothetical protein